MMAKVYVLRNCRVDMTSHGDFVWPKSGYVSCSDWSEEKEFGNGLYGFLWGIGDTTLFYPSEDCYWLIVEVDEDKIIDLEGKVKFPSGNVVFCTQSRDEAIEKMIEYGANPNTIMYGTSTSGDNGKSISGDRGTSTSGDYGTSISGDYGTSTSGDGGTSTSGDRGTSTSGDNGNSISGNGGTSTSGFYGTSISGDYGYSYSNDGKVKTGNKGIVAIQYYDLNKNRYSIKVGHVPEELKVNTFYRVVDGEWVETD